MSNELNPCPYCGGAGAQIDTRVDELSYVVCSCCGAFGPSGIGADGATAAWNHRVPAERLVDANKSSQPNPPLTLEELLDLAGKEPVYAVSDFCPKGNWCVLGTTRSLGGEKTLVAIYGRDIALSGEDYGGSWFAYRRKPEEGVEMADENMQVERLSDDEILAAYHSGFDHETGYYDGDALGKDSLIRLCRMKDKTNAMLDRRLQAAKDVIDLVSERIGINPKDTSFFLYSPNIDHSSPIIEKMDEYFSRSGDKVKLKKRIDELEDENRILRSLIAGEKK